MTKKVCEVLLDVIAPISTRQFFGMTGDTLNPLLDAIRRDGRFEWMGVRHEEAGAFAAAAQAKLTGRLGLCAGTTGPGALHLINGLYDAKRDRAPVLAITGHVPIAEIGSSYFQETNLKAIFEDICVFNEYISDATQLPRMAQQAVQAAMTEGGVAHLAVPSDVINRDVPASKLAREILIPKSTMLPCPGELQKAADVLNRGGNIAILAGDGCRGAGPELLLLAQKLKAPIVRTLRATDIIEYENPYWIGGVGMLGSPQGVAALDDCDTLLMLGTDFPYSVFLPSDSTIIQIDIRPSHIGRRCAVDVGIVGHVRASLMELAPLLLPNENTSFLATLQSQRKQWDSKMDRKATVSKSKQIHPQAVTRLASDLADDDAVFVVDVGEVTAFAARHLRMRGTQRLLGSFNHGSLGVALPGAIGAQALDQGRQVIALAGDGAFGMMMQDFVTAVRYELPIVCIVYNNHKLGFVEMEMQATGFPKYGTRLVNPRFADYAAVCGAEGIKVTDPSELENALRTAFSARKPYIIDVEVNPDELILPPRLDAAHAWGYSLAKLKELFVEEERM
jgi:thiamine pyrophosphate-dependent acetolactate synthase large subunit-like protein